MNPSGFIRRSCFFAAVILTAVSAALSDTLFWIGTANSNWNVAGNWNLGRVPAEGDDVLITNIGTRRVILAEPTPLLNSFTISNGTLVFTNWTTVLNAEQVTIGNGGVLTMPAAFATNQMSNRIAIACGDLLIATGGVINADRLGFQRANGPGASPTVATYSSGGAGHGGRGGISGHLYAGGEEYNTPSNPIVPGSGAGNTTSCQGGPGGGAVWIQASGRITVHGLISANGSPGTVASSRDGGGGAGGSILLICETFAGTGGVIRADGARTSSLAGGGGGGRIALHYSPQAQALLDPPQVEFSVKPGLGYVYERDRFLMADYGTIYLSDSSSVFRVSNVVSGFHGHLIFPEGFSTFSTDAFRLQNACIGFATEPFAYDIAGPITLSDTNSGLIGRGAVTISCSALTNAGLIKLGSNSTVQVNGSVVMPNGEWTMRDGGTVSVGDGVVVSGAAGVVNWQGFEAAVTGNVLLTSGAAAHFVGDPTNGVPGAWGARLRVEGDVRLESNSWIFPYSDVTNGGSPYLVCRNLEVESGCGFNADGKGFDVSSGPGGAPTVGTTTGSGGAYGGRGGRASSGADFGLPYGSALYPIDAGSGGAKTTSSGGGRGGGVIRVEAQERILINGTMTVCGMAGGAYGGREGGGGAGGSIYLKAPIIAGTNGILRADGGNAPYSSTWGGAGSGGRIALLYDPAAQSQIPRPSLRITVNPGNNYPEARLWRTADWGTLCFSDVSGIFSLSNQISNVGGYLVITNGEPTIFAADNLILSDAWIGFESPSVDWTIAGPIVIHTNGGLLGRTPFSLSCSNLINYGVIRLSPEMALSVNGNLLNSNALFSLGGDSTLSVKGSVKLQGGTSRLSFEGVDASVSGDWLMETGTLFSFFALSTNGGFWDWGARLSVSGAVTIASDSWIHPYSHPTNGGAPLLRCRTLQVASGGGIDAVGRGYDQNQGPGKGQLAGTDPGAGGGHGGKGGNSSSTRKGGNAYAQTLFAPYSGSGGGSTTSARGGMGGGVIRLEAKEVVLDGTLSVQGGNGGVFTAREGGAGAGGSIFLVTERFSGSANGQLNADGGLAATSSGGTVGGGGGGGGRIAVWMRATTDRVARILADSNAVPYRVEAFSPHFAGMASASGGAGWQSGEDGWIEFITVLARPGTLMVIR